MLKGEPDSHEIRPSRAHPTLPKGRAANLADVSVVSVLDAFA